MKKSTHTHDHHFHMGKTAITVLLAAAFLTLVMCLSYLFITGSLK
jgi:hypothetical protein